MPLLDPPTNPGRSAPRHRPVTDPPWYRRRRWQGFPHWLWALLAVTCCAVLATALILRDAAQPPRTSAGVTVVTPAPSPPVVVAPSPADLPEGVFAGDGRTGDLVTYIVGTHEFQPGTYATPGALDPARPCRWGHLRLRSEGDVPRRVTGREGVGPQTVILEIGDVLESQGCGPWAPAPEAEE